jgi:phosphoribosylformimino-5-aminoimidazole carboxamide ribotide isomerase
MVIPAIDLQGGAVVQLVQGEREALRCDLDDTLERFRGFPVLQIIDLDAAKGLGSNGPLVERCCRAGFSVRVGGGIRSLDRAREVLEWGADRIIVGSAAFKDDRADATLLQKLLPLGRDRVIVAVDSRGDYIAVNGWRGVLKLTTTDAIAALEPLCGEFLYTQIESEGLMRGLPLRYVERVRAATANRLSVAGGICSIAEIESLERLGCSSVLGMAVYTGLLPLESLRRFA